jgi:uncharacterized protein YcbX
VFRTVLVGHVDELWRYPVKSMRGERRSTVQVCERYGIPGDRGWALRDEKVGEIRGARKMPPLIRCQARYLEEPDAASTPTVEITLPDGDRVTSTDPDVNDRLSAVVGREVTLWPRQPATSRDHFRRKIALDDKEMRESLLLEADESIPEFTGFAPETVAQSMEFAVTPGTYFDAFPMSLLTSTSMAALAALSPDSAIATPRFRQNIIVEGTSHLEGFAEFDWAGRQLRIGSVIMGVVAAIPRCAMVTLAQGELPQDRTILRTLVQETKMNLGIYLEIAQPGEITEGDEVELI